MSEEDYPRVVGLLKERVPHWKLVPGANIDDIIERAIDKTMCGLLNEFESVLKDYETMKSFLVMAGCRPAPDTSNIENTVKRCAFNSTIGCNQGRTGNLINHGDRSEYQETTIMCAAWSSGRCQRLPIIVSRTG